MILTKLCDIIIILLCFLLLRECTNKTSFPIEPKYHLVSEAYNLAKKLFTQTVNSYETLKNSALNSIDTFLELVYILNDEMAREVRTVIIKFYKIKYFHDFTSYVITMEDMIDTSDHCLIGPVEKLEEIREHFHKLIRNFQDIRHFDTVEQCLNEMPDEVAVAHCILHQAVLFNETMHESLTKIVEIKTRHHVQDINSSLYDVQRCFQGFVPDFYEQLLTDAYTSTCGFLRIVNASAFDLVNDKCPYSNETKFVRKWGPVVKILKEKSSSTRQLQKPIFLTLFAANLTSQDIVKTLYGD